MNTPVHYSHPDHLVGDVHPYYDKNTKTWLLYYLQPGGQFHSRLASSKDGFNWRHEEMQFHGTPRANYYVVAIMKESNHFYSWFGQQYVHVCSVSQDGRHWQADPSLDIPVNKTISPLGERDPYVVYDDASKCYFLVALSYTQGPKDCAIILKRSKNRNLTSWESNTKVILSFPNGLTWSNGEPECPQLMKIGRRWYLFASLARRTTHHVGALSYWVGDLDKAPDQVKWSAKPRYLLTSEDLCAAQLVLKGQTPYLMGWIAQQAQGPEWGGHLNIPLKIKSLRNGLLTTNWDRSFMKHYQRQVVETVSNQKAFQSKQTVSSIFYVQAKLQMSQRVIFEWVQEGLNPIHLVFDADLKQMMVTFSPLNHFLADLPLPSNVFKKPLEIEIIGDHDMLEVNVNHQHTLHVRLPRSLQGDQLIVSDCSQLSLTLEHWK